MDIKQEKALRDSLANFILNWQTDDDPKALENAAPENYTRLITGAHIVADEASKALTQWVQAGRRAGISWADIGSILGISRQAAQQRFSTNAADIFSNEPNFNPRESKRIARKNITAFNEVQALKEEGAKGRKLVGATWLTLYFTQTDHPVENIRIVSLRGHSVIENYEKLGWTHALTWFPFQYFTRPLAK